MRRDDEFGMNNPQIRGRPDLLISSALSAGSLPGNRSRRNRPPLFNMPRKAPVQRRVPLAGAAGAEALNQFELSQIKVRRGVKFLPVLGAASLTLAHLLTAAAFHRKTREIFARLENTVTAEPEAVPILAIVQSFARCAVGRNPAPRAVCLRQTGEMRAAQCPMATVHRRAGDQCA
jgi:hypothetical protein